ncbi:MAG: alpha/beta fold hydrolase [Geminicoccaceae bacterium]
MRDDRWRREDGDGGAGTRLGGLVMHDGFRLPLLSWEPVGTPLATIIALHAFGDFRRAFEEVGPELARRGYRVHAFDQRGFGDTLGHGQWHGWRRLVRDLRQAIERLRPADGMPVYLLGESMGGGVALVAAARFRPAGVAGVILVEPAVRRGVRWRLMWDVAVGTLALLAPGYSRRLQRGWQPELTERARARLAGDPRIVRTIRADAYRGLLALADAASAATRRVRLPVLLLYGRADGIIPLRLFEQATLDLAPRVTALRYPAAPHLLLQTESWSEVLADIEAWIAGEPLPASTEGVLLAPGPRPGEPVALPLRRPLVPGMGLRRRARRGAAPPAG